MLRLESPRVGNVRVRALRPGWVALLSGFALLASLNVQAAPKTDLIVLMNGDHVTGEIKGLEHNRLRVSTDSMGTIYIEWDKVASIKTDQFLLLERADGLNYYGQLTRAGQEAQLAVRTSKDAAPEIVPTSTIVRAQPISGGSLKDRFDGYLSGGLDFTKASSQRNFNFGAGLSSRTREREWSLDLATNVTDDSAGTTSERYDLKGIWRQQRPERNFWQGFGGLTRSSELDLDLRATAGGGIGHYFVQTNVADWVGGIGLGYSHEIYTAGETVDSLEGVLTTSFSIFHYDFPETDISGRMSLLPSLTQSGRYRAEADLRAKYEFVDDLYFELKVYGSYDSKPPTADLEQSDYGVVTSLGYSF